MCKIISGSDNKSSAENKMGREGGDWVVVGGLSVEVMWRQRSE